MTPAARIAVLRLARAPRATIPVVLWALLALGAAFVERSRTWPAAGHVLLGAFGALALPLLVYVIVGATAAGKGMSPALRPLLAFGADPARAALATLAVAAIASALACGLVGGVVDAVAHGASDPPLARDAFTTAWIGALAGLVYAAYFTLGAALLRGGAGRAILLAVDWILGVGSGAGGLLTPRAHVRSLLGGARAFGLSQRASFVVLVLLMLVYAALAVTLCARRARR